MSDPTDGAREALLALAEQFTPYYEAAEGQKAELIRRGWSATHAERIAAEVAAGWIGLVFAQLKPH